MKNMFSPAETEVLKLLGSKKMTIKQLTDRIYDNAGLAESNIVAGVVRRINRKCAAHHLDWYIFGKGTGRGGRTVWKVTAFR